MPASTQFFGPTLADFLGRYSGVQLDVVCTDRSVDLVEESFDIALRAGPLSDSTLVARSLGTVGYLLVANPRYLEKRGRPRSPQALSKHDCLVFNVGQQPRVWRLTQGYEAGDVNLTPALAVNDLDMLHDAARSGAGIALLPTYRCADDLRALRLERVLPDWEAPSVPIHAV